MPLKFIKKAIKKVFKGTKKFFKKYGKYVLGAAAIFFTAGVATGWSAFAGGVKGVGGFFTAAGKTIAGGASKAAGAMGFGGASGTASSAATAGTTASVKASITNSIINPATKAAITKAANSTGGGIMATIGSLAKNSMAMAAVAQGANVYMQQQQFKRDRKIIENRSWYGGPAHGGGDTYSGGMLNIKINPGEQTGAMINNDLNSINTIPSPLIEQEEEENKNPAMIPSPVFGVNNG